MITTTIHHIYALNVNNNYIRKFHIFFMNTSIQQINKEDYPKRSHKEIICRTFEGIEKEIST